MEVEIGVYSVFQMAYEGQLLGLTEVQTMGAKLSTIAHFDRYGAGAQQKKTIGLSGCAKPQKVNYVVEICVNNLYVEFLAIGVPISFSGEMAQPPSRYMDLSFTIGLISDRQQEEIKIYPSCKSLHDNHYQNVPSEKRPDGRAQPASVLDSHSSMFSQMGSRHDEGTLRERQTCWKRGTCNLM